MLWLQGQLEAAMDVDVAEKPAAVSHPLTKKAKALNRARAGGVARITPPKLPSLATGEMSEGDRHLLRLPRRWQVRHLASPPFVSDR